MKFETESGSSPKSLTTPEGDIEKPQEIEHVADKKGNLVLKFKDNSFFGT